MRTKLTLLIVVIFCSNILLAQSSAYEKGYFIDNQNNKIECFIKNDEWNYNPTEFEYKTDGNSASKIIQLADFKEFSVGEEYKFKKANVKIDKSNDNAQKVSPNKAMNFVDDVLLLRVRAEGKAILYSYNTRDYLRFFYSLDSGPIIPLSYKIYYNRDEYDNAKNETYKQELLNALKCESISQADINRLEYTSSSLYEFFIKYNTCTGTLTEKFEGKKNHNTFELYAKAGAGMSSFSFNSNNGYSADFSKKINFKFGAEVEINLSNKFKKWSALVEVVYRHYTNSYEYGSANLVKMELDYTAIDISVGIRRYLNLSPKSDFFLNGYLTYGHNLDSREDFHPFELTTKGSINTAFGAGYIYDKKYSLELRYELQRSLFLTADSKFSTVGVMAGYRFL